MLDNGCNLDSTGAAMEIDFGKLIDTFKNRYKLILVVTLLITMLSALLNLFLFTPIYEAKTLLMVTIASEKLQTPTSQNTRIDPNTGISATMPVLTMNTYLGQLKSEVVMNRLMEKVNTPKYTAGALNAQIEATIVKDSNLIEVKVYDPDPYMAAFIANSLSDVYLNLMKEFMFSSVVVISPANPPKLPVKPNKELNIAISFVLALMLAFLVAVVIERLDNTIKTAEDVGRNLELPVLGVIPIRASSYAKNSGSLGGQR